MIPSLSENNALLLAKEYSFTGGQIENIARKYIINDILGTNSDSSQISVLRQFCASELLHSKGSNRIGF